MQGALGTVAEQNQTTGQGTRLVDVLCGEESDTPQGSEPVAKQARTDDHSMNVGQVTPPVVPGRETKGPGGSDVEFLRQLVKGTASTVERRRACSQCRNTSCSGRDTGSQRAASKPRFDASIYSACCGCGCASCVHEYRRSISDGSESCSRISGTAQESSERCT